METQKDEGIHIAPSTNLWNKLALGHITREEFQIEMDKIKGSVDKNLQK